MKKFLSLAAVICSAMLCAQVKIDQSTARAALESCMTEMDARFAVMPPGEMEKFSSYTYNTEIGRTIGTLLTMSSDAPHAKWVFIPQDPQAREKYIQNCLLHKKYFKEINGKWYVDFRVLFITLSPEEQQEAERFVSQMVSYAAGNNWEAFRQNLSPAVQEEVLKRFGSFENFKKEMAANQEFTRMIKELNDPQIQQHFFPFIIFAMNEEKILKKNGNKYIIDNEPSIN